MDTGQRRAAIICASVMVSFSAIFYRLSDAPSMVMVFYRMLFASAIIVPVALWKCRGEFASMERRDVLVSILSGIVFAVHLATYFESLDRVSIASCLVLTDTAVFFVALIMIVFFGESVSRRGWGIMALTFGGCVIIAIDDMSGDSGIIGDGLALFSSLLFAVYAIIGRRVRGRMSTLAYTAILYSSAALTSLVMVASGDAGELDCGTENLLYALGLAVFCTIFGHTVYNWGLRYEKASFVAITTLLEPVFGSVLGLAVFGEIPGALVIAGSAVVLIGVYMFSCESRPQTVEIPISKL
ncbi:Permeases of the drug/metabolite transporter (DMT) superfamily [Thermoplasmatales archaeon BRNA1]|nr:Permeases of the drug/metabolite transporter (DMT) superfamily [Thermoplasmatales archaeon BRNA1]